MSQIGVAAAALAASLLFVVPHALPNPIPSTDYTAMSLEDLLSIEITSVSKKPEKLSDAAAAIFVVTADDIRLTGATSIPEALRMVPGIQVARIDANKWAVSSRGFNERYANKLLVVVDGRSVYTPLFSGVHWDVEGVMMENIDRIEVIRGPGATLWGANAVNGVINIITKDAVSTPGWLVSGAAGSEERGFGQAQYGGQFQGAGHYRVGLEYAAHDRSGALAGDNEFDGWNLGRVEGRLDWQPSNRDWLTLNGDVFRQRTEFRSLVPTLTAPYIDVQEGIGDAAGGSATLRWRRQLSTSSELSTQVYFQRSDRTMPVEEVRETLDLDMQHPFRLGGRHSLVWGLGYRHTRDRVTNNALVTVEPPRRFDDLFSLFVQDDIELLRDRLVVTLGSKFEHNDYTGLEIQPSARFRWTASSRQTVWGTVSRAVRTPSRADAHVVALAAVVPPETLTNPWAIPMEVKFFGNENFQSEDLVAYELGYRARLGSNLVLDLSSFYNDYDNLRSARLGPVFAEDDPVPHTVLPLLASNDGRGHTTGFEMAADFQAAPWWRLHGAYTYIKVDLEGQTSLGDNFFVDTSPSHTVSVRSSTDLTRDLALSVWFRFVDELREAAVPAYATLDVNAEWRVSRVLGIAVAGQNLLSAEHRESPTTGLAEAPGSIERGVYCKVTWRH